MPLLHMTEEGELFTEIALGKQRNRVDRYVTQFLVERLTGPHAGTRTWVSFEQFERLWDTHRVADDSRMGQASNSPLSPAAAVSQLTGAPTAVPVLRPRPRLKLCVMLMQACTHVRTPCSISSEIPLGRVEPERLRRYRSLRDLR